MAKKSRLNALAPLSEAENLVSAKLRAHVVMLAGMIGARSLTSSPEGLEKAAKYIEQVFSEYDYIRSQQDFMVTVPDAAGSVSTGKTAMPTSVTAAGTVMPASGAAATRSTTTGASKGAATGAATAAARGSSHCSPERDGSGAADATAATSATGTVSSALSQGKRVCTRNIIAELKGTKVPQEIIILGAHYDSVYDCPAANDNGSGVASMLELARLLSKFSSPRTIRFVAFTNEEPPFFGTDAWGAQQYASLCHERQEKVVAMLSLETMGYFSDKPGSQTFPHDVFGLVYPKQGDFITFVSNLHSRRLLNQFTKLFRSATSFPCEKVAVPESIRGVAFSDHAAFWKYDYPALMVTDTAFYRYPHYHTKDDTPEKVDYDRLARVVFGIATVVKELSNR